MGCAKFIQGYTKVYHKSASDHDHSFNISAFHKPMVIWSGLQISIFKNGNENHIIWSQQNGHAGKSMGLAICWPDDKVA